MHLHSFLYLLLSTLGKGGNGYGGFGFCYSPATGSVLAQVRHYPALPQDLLAVTYMLSMEYDFSCKRRLTQKEQAALPEKDFWEYQKLEAEDDIKKSQAKIALAL